MHSHLAAKRSIEPLLKNLVDNFIVGAMKQPFSFKPFQCFALHGIVFTGLTCFAVADSLPFHNITLPHGQILNSFDLDHFDVVLEVRRAKSRQEGILYCGSL